jgi:hypothetical protein
MHEQIGRPGHGRSSTDFFGRQNDAQRATRRVPMLFALSVASVIVAPVAVLALGKYAFLLQSARERPDLGAVLRKIQALSYLNPPSLLTEVSS